ncbi:hypothetical protein [Thiohalophilus sp.]|uniref:hypothetical protein n=1 Tax=Thiohalophilus sp. TaxID=3028392 RepID=UPI002ACD3DF5|nr:hypothetical protein [Thiohalophilus sp.]MDZ7660978.1 hypothetical protein [Thiohalophilus sp.]
MIFARMLTLIGSVIALFGLWKFIAPLIYSNIGTDFMQGVISLVLGGMLALIGRQLERRQGDGAGSNE